MTNPGSYGESVVKAGFIYMCVLVDQSYPTLCDPMDCNLPGSSIHGIFQARILEGIVISFSIYFYYLFIHLLLNNIFSKSLLNLLGYYFCLMFWFFWP